jgi:hypothetical protein
MNMRHLISALALGLCAIPQTSQAQQVSAPGWNQETAKPGELRFEHVSGKGSVWVNIIDAVPDDQIANLLRSTMAKLDTNGVCPNGQYAVATSVMDGKAWQAQSNGYKTCQITVKRIDAKKLYFIIALETKDSGTGTQQFASDLLYGLSGETKRENDKEAEIATKNPPITSPTVIPSSANIVALFHDDQRSANFQSATPDGMIMINTVYYQDAELLFKDGTACRSCIVEWTKDQSLTQYRKDNPDDIGKWTKVSGGYSIIYPDETKVTIKKSSDSKGAVQAGKRFNNLVVKSVANRSSGDGITYMGLVTTDTLFLGADGSFMWVSEGQSWRPTQIVEVINSAGPKQSGTYSVSDYGIKLDYKNGKTEVLSLITFADAPDYLVIDGAGFIPKKKD